MRTMIWTLLPLLLACGDQGDAPSSGGDGSTDSGPEGGDSGDGGDGGEAFDAADQLELLLTGHYDSADQAAENAAYYNILLTMCPVSMPDVGTRVLYVEQAVADTPAQPYRQRVYNIIPGADPATQAISQVYEVRQANSVIGACDDPDSFDKTSAGILALEGCDVHLDWDGQGFAGGTVEDHCGTDWQGAVYATSEIALDEDTLASWDRGYDADDAQVWGATQGAYVFTRRTALGAWN